MIKKININNLGLYKNFQWDTIRDVPGNNIKELQKENIIYGRNYSGKTTLSRIIRALETKELSSKYLNPEFEILLNDNIIINQGNYKENALNVRCFNDDFIKENLSFIVNPDSHIKPFAVLGENSEIESQIEFIKTELGVNRSEDRTLKYKELDDLETLVASGKSELTSLRRNLDSQLMNKATGGGDSIKQQHLKFGDINYNKAKLQQEINFILSPSYENIDSTREALNLIQITEVQKANVNRKIDFENIYNKRLPDVISWLSKPLLNINKITALLTDVYLNEWVKKGYEIHADDRTCECKFCGNFIQESRWLELDNHFDEESKTIERSLSVFKQEIQMELDKIMSFVFPNPEVFYLNFHTELLDCAKNFDLEITKYKADLIHLLSKINERLTTIHKPILFDYKPTFSEEKINEIIANYDDIRNRNNDYSHELSDKINEARIELRRLEVKRFVDTIQYSVAQDNITAKEVEYDGKELEKNELKKYILLKEKEIEDLSRQLNNEEEGARKVNEYLQNYFGHQNLELQAIEDEVDSDKKIKFNIIRNGNIAYHLSEGECSIISFCYFMAKLDDIHTAGQKPIILIDDPISSLDSNHIFYIYSLINSELFMKDRYKQIFISTHNLDFLKYLKRLKLTKNQHEYFIINRYQNHSEITLMPNYLKNYVTEFNYLFENIYKCANAEIVTDENHHLYYNFGNNARKFLEALLFYKYPSKIDNQTQNANSKRLLKYFGEDQQAATLTDRVNNELSHLEEIFDRGMNPIEIPELKKVAQYILDKMKVKDEEQYSALLESIGVGPETTVRIHV
ncbi:AAA family ATPase [Sphingobacterium siyangense]|uniref:AAA family ATPase n=1 Tax=Sphingobacterium siyangense TaxID=459529 RepID=UPI0031F901E3